MWRKTKLSEKLKGFVVTVGFFAATILIFASSVAEWEPRSHWGILFAYTLLTIFSTFAPIRTMNTILTLNNAVIFSGILLFGAWVGVWSALVETLILSFLARFHAVKAVSNIGQLVLTIWAVDSLKTGLEKLAFSPIFIDFILVIAYWSINIVLCGLAISYFFRTGWFLTVKNMAKGTSLTYLLLMWIAAIGSRLVETYGILTLLPIAATFIAISIVFHQYYDSLKKLQQKVEEVKTFNHHFLTAMAASIDARDRYTSGHSLRVAYWGREIARQLGLPPQKVEEVYFGGILHDIGKIGIRDEILNKKGKLSPEEYEKIKQHTVIGYEIVKQAGVFDELLPAIRSHHERLDGTGYPDGLRGDEIPLIARILAISDAFDAMVADRPYRKGLPVEEALQEIQRGAGKQFDAELAGHFIRVVRQLPRDELERLLRQDRGAAQDHLKDAIL